MEVEAALYGHLSDSTRALYALCGQRLYPYVVPQDADLPAMAYQRISTTRILAHDGPGSVAQCRMQLTILGDTYDEVKEVSRTVRQMLNGWRGEMGTTSEKLMVHEILIDNDLDGYNDPTERRTVRLDAVIVYRED